MDCIVRIGTVGLNRCFYVATPSTGDAAKSRGDMEVAEQSRHFHRGTLPAVRVIERKCKGCAKRSPFGSLWFYFIELGGINLQ